MKLYRFYIDGEPRIGADTGDGATDVTDLVASKTLEEVISSPTLTDDIQAAASSKTRERIIPEDFRQAELLRPGKVLCVGLNYRKHAAECRLAEPSNPVFFSKFGDAICASGDDIPLPETLSHFDYECELVIVIGKETVNVSVGDADEYIYGYTCGNDFSARDGQFVTSQWLAGKAGYRFAPIGPCIVTRDSMDPSSEVRITTRVNGELRQDGLTNDMIFDCREIVSHASRYFRLMPGDVIFTGTPSGVIHGSNGAYPWLKAGDRIEIEIDGIGMLSNTTVKP